MPHLSSDEPRAEQPAVADLAARTAGSSTAPADPPAARRGGRRAGSSARPPDRRPRRTPPGVRPSGSSISRTPPKPAASRSSAVAVGGRADRRLVVVGERDRRDRIRRERSLDRAGMASRRPPRGARRRRCCVHPARTIPRVPRYGHRRCEAPPRRRSRSNRNRSCRRCSRPFQNSIVVRREAVPAPVRGQRDVVGGKRRGDLRVGRVELLARADRTALLRGPGPDPRLARPGPEVGDGRSSSDRTRRSR